MTIDIETPRLLLRHWKETDIDGFIEINADKEVMRYFPEPHSEERTRCLYVKIQEEFKELGYGLYAAEEKLSGSFMGFIGFHWARLDVDFCPCIEIGWRLAKQFWGKGYATEGAKASLEHGFNNLGFDKVHSFTAIENYPSQRIMQKIGMQLEQYFDHPEIPQKHPLKPHVCYIVNKNDIYPR